MSSLQPVSTNLPQIHGTKPKQLLVEGADDRGVFQALLTSMGIDDIEVRSYGGKSNFRGFLRNLIETDEFEFVQSIGIHRDADLDASGAGQSVRDALRYFGLPIPSKTNKIGRKRGYPNVAYLLVPHGESEGAMEDVVLGLDKTG